MRFLFCTQHFFAPNYRSAGMHQMARALAGGGHRVDFVTVAQGWLKQRLSSRTRDYAKGARKALAEGINPANIHAHVHREIVHAPSGSPLINALTVPLDRVYGRRLDATFAAAARKADIIVLECGYPLYYFEALRRLNGRARFVAFYMDRMELVGFRPEIHTRHRAYMPQFDMVRTNAERLLDYLPAGTNGRYVPQGVDKARMKLDCPSPYEPGTRNIVSVGDMLFDDPAVRMIAEAAAGQGAQLHVIGARMDQPRSGTTVHGEMSFERTLPYIVHAEVGLAPYRLVEGADYLVQSSLKIQQYSYCGLPVLLARGLDIKGGHFVYYDPADAPDIANAVQRALATPKDLAYGASVMDWPEIGRLFETMVRELD